MGINLGFKIIFSIFIAPPTPSNSDHSGVDPENTWWQQDFFHRCETNYRKFSLREKMQQELPRENEWMRFGLVREEDAHRGAVPWQYGAYLRAVSAQARVTWHAH